ncbi:sulfatase family protein [Membranihabitans maritimus]|uniref:sulfatase family protein n=1 Tax=Membranihabitans maritimus TaxID=2904244 RepID=UPI001F2CD41A|nr:arylsulfatase [Membranihabitans maritimus]
MIKFHEYFLFIVGFLFLIACSNTSGDSPNSKNATDSPNIVIILADDLGYGDVSYQNPQSKVRTPNIDDLANQGMVFTDAHSSSSVCTPSRYSLLTGRYSWRTRLKKGVLYSYDRELIDSNQTTVATVLKKSGYNTAVIGKWHLGMKWTLQDGTYIPKSADRKKFTWDVDFSKPVQNGPLSVGFDYFFGLSGPANHPPFTYIENNSVVSIPTLPKPDSVFGQPGLMAEGWSYEKVLSRITGKAVEYINQQNKDTPFFLYFSLTSPHTPIAPSEAFKGTSEAGPYGDFVQETDWSVGEILRALENQNFAETTIVIFTSDNGSPARITSRSAPYSVIEEYNHHANGMWRGVKSDIWEGGHRVPFMIKWPKKIQPGSSCDKTIDFIDLMATISEILGIKLSQKGIRDSYSLLPILTNNGNGHYRRDVAIHHSFYGKFGLRKGKWKFIPSLGPGGFAKPRIIEPAREGVEGQLYDLVQDPTESNNLWLKYPEIVDSLSSVLNAYQKN